MQKLAKRLSVFMVAIMTLSVMLNFVIAAPAKAAQGFPQIKYAEEPKLEYTVGDRVQFNLHAPNYGGRVQYRVVLWNDETKSYRDLWTATPDRYYDKWMPYGNNIFTLGWVINEPGHYRITIYAKRAGVINNETYLKGFNCDSYMESDSFVVKAKQEEAKPDVASEKIELSSVTSSPAAINGYMSKSTQAVVGKDYELAVKVDKPGVKVMFQLDAPDGSLNKDEVLEAVSGSDNVAKVSYKRLNADADYVTAYVAAAPTVRTAMKVYWGVDKILSIAATDEDAAKASNGNVKSYKVTLKNPITGEKMRNRELRVLVRENIDTPNNAALSTALITNPYSGVKSSTYQRMNNIITGGLNQETVILKTNDNGEAAFTVTGINTKATPVVFFDSSFFYVTPDDKAWGGLQDSSQYKASYGGNDNLRWDATELQAEPATVTFNASTFTFEQAEIADPYTAVSDYKSGRNYTITVKDSEGKPYKNGLVNIAISEMIDSVYGTNTNARIIKAGTASNKLKDIVASNPRNLRDSLGRFYKIEFTTTSEGKLCFQIASNKLNDMATPIIWIDQDNANASNGIRNGILETADPQKLLSQTTFVEAAIKSGAFKVALSNESLNMDEQENVDAVSINGEPVLFKYDVRDQNGNLWMPAGSFANITYTIQNTGSSTIKVYEPIADKILADGITVDNETGWPAGRYNPIEIPTYQTRTISFRTTKETNNYIKMVADGSGMVSVTANANISGQTNTSGAWLAPVTKVASWVETTDAEDYAVAKSLFTSTVFGYNIAENYAIVNPVTDTSSFIKIPYLVEDEFTLQTQQHTQTIASNINEFEEQISFKDSLTYRYVPDDKNDAGVIIRIRPDYVSLYNADNSYDNDTDEDLVSLIKTNVIKGINTVTEYNQVTRIKVATGTGVSQVGAYHIGTKEFPVTAGMSAAAVAQMIADAKAITFTYVDGEETKTIDFNVALDANDPRTLIFTRKLAKNELINIFDQFVDEGSEISIDLINTKVVENVIEGTSELATIEVKSITHSASTIHVSFSDGAVKFDTYVNITAADDAQKVASMLRDAIAYQLDGVKLEGEEGYTVTVENNIVTITRNVVGEAEFVIVVR